MRALENERSLTILQKNVSAEEDQPKNLLLSKVSALCEDLEEEEAEVLEDHTDLATKSSRVKICRAKKKIDLSNVRRSARFKNKKSI